MLVNYEKHTALKRAQKMNQLTLKKSFTSIIFAVGIAFATQVTASTYLYEIDNPSGSNGAGNIASFTTIYDDVNEQLSFKSTIQKANGNIANGFWLVLSDGPFPIDNKKEYAIFYGDANTGNLTASVYDGSNSWHTPGEFIESFAGGLGIDTTTNDEVTFSFEINVSGINAFNPTIPTGYTNDWDGASFGENIGIWYQPVVFSDDPTYENGKLTSFPYSISSWYDTNGLPTTEILPDVGTVPAPATAWLIFVGLIGFAGANRRRI